MRTAMNPTIPKVSILIPVYNRDMYIGDCIASAINQTFSNIEIVVVDNASDDRTWELCQQCARDDPRVRVFRNDSNLGPVRNWQRCVEEAAGEYCKILFSDDLLDPECIKEMLPFFENPEVGFVFSPALIGTTQQEARVDYLSPRNQLLDRAAYLERLVDDDVPLSPGAILIRRKDLSSNLVLDIPSATSRPYQNNGAGPDILISLLTSRDYRYVAALSRPLVFFREHESSFSIRDENHSVRYGYASAIGYFLQSSGHRKLWLKYLGKNWLTAMALERKWISPGRYARAHEGSGSIAEVVRIVFWGLIFLPSMVAPSILGRN